MWFLAVLLACQSPGTSEFEAGLASTRAGNQAEAVERFRAALDAGARAPETYHGLGNALYRSGQRGAAMAAWWRGVLLAPRNGDIAANLTRAQAESPDQLEPPQTHRGAFFWQTALSPRESGLVASACLAVGLWIVAIRQWRRIRQPQSRRRQGRGWAVFMLGMGVLLSLSTWDAMQQRRGAVVVIDSVSVRSALGPAGVDLFVLHEGAQVRLVETTETHALVMLSDGRKGWLTSRAIITSDPAGTFPVPGNGG